MSVVFVLGGPGSGKGTQCKKLVEEYGWSHYSTGDLLRQEIASGSAVGQECAGIVQEGGIVPTDILLDLLKKAMESNPGKNCLVDGFPRSVDQVELFQSQIGPCDLCLYYRISDELMMERLTLRSATSGRSDDNPETIAKRIEVFHQQTLPVVDLLEQQGKLRTVGAGPGPDAVFAATKKVLQDAGLAPAPAGDEQTIPAVHGRPLANGKHIVFILGGPGSGKGTQCKKMVEQYGWSHYSTGDLLRQEIASGSQVGKECADIVQQGGIVPTEVLLGLLHKAMQASDGSICLVDGFPRSVDQVELFEAQIGPYDLCLYYRISDELMMERLTLRSATSGRSDDNPETIAKRIEVFHQQTLPVVDLLEQQGKLRTVGAWAGPAEVFAAAERVLLEAGLVPGTERLVRLVPEVAADGTVKAQLMMEEGGAAAEGKPAGLEAAELIASSPDALASTQAVADAAGAEDALSPALGAARLVALSLAVDEAAGYVKLHHAVLNGSVDPLAETQALPEEPQTAAHVEACAAVLPVSVALSLACVGDDRVQINLMVLDGETAPDALASTMALADAAPEPLPEPEPAAAAAAEPASKADAAEDVPAQAAVPEAAAPASAQTVQPAEEEAAVVPAATTDSCTGDNGAAEAEASAAGAVAGAAHRVVALCCPEGYSRKLQLIQELQKKLPEKLVLPVCHTTRMPSPGEISGARHNFVTVSEFRRAIDKKQFVEFQEVRGNLYGTTLEAVEKVTQAGGLCLLDLCMQSASLLQSSALAESTLFLFAAPRTLQGLEMRLRSCADDKHIPALIASASAEYDEVARSGSPYHHVVLEDDVEGACEVVRGKLEERFPGSTAGWGHPPSTAAAAAAATASGTAASGAATPPVAGGVPRSSVEARVPVREYMNSTVVPLLKEGLKELNRARPTDPVQFLADWLVAHKPRH